MADVVSDVAVQVSADISPLRRELAKGGRSFKNFERSAEEMSRRMVRAGVAITAAFGAATAAAVVMARRAAEAGEQIGNLARIAGTTPETFQRMAAASRSVGIEQEKLSDILKDVQDRVGDFLATGGGPMADFFENIAPKVGVTADQFARLSGPEALQLYVSSLERANVTQNEMTFYLEAMSSDLVALLPLLRNNGAEMDRLGQAAADAGTILSNETVKGAEELSRSFRDMRDQMRGELIKAFGDVQDEIKILAEFVQDYGIPALQAMIEVAAKVAQGIGVISSALREMRGEAGLTAAEYDDNRPPGPDADLFGDREPTTTGTWTVDDFIMEGLTGGRTRPRARPVARIRPQARPDVDTGYSSSGTSSGPTEEDFERLREQFATEQEIIQENYDRQMEQLEEFRRQKVSTEEEFNEIERRIQEEHQQKMLDLERKRRAATLNAVAGAFGDLSSLMQSENKKLFAIGKAAAVAEATIKGYQAAVDAWQKGMSVGGPPVAAAFTAASLAKTGALIAGIMGTSYGGGGGAAAAGGGGAVGTGIGNASGPALDAGSNVSRTAVIRLEGETFTRRQVIELGEELNEFYEDGGRLVFR